MKATQNMALKEEQSKKKIVNSGTKSWDKVCLENHIFRQVALKEAIVYSRAGRLYVLGGGDVLQALVSIYNHFFGRQNERFMRAARRNRAQEEYAFACHYGQEEKQMPIQKLFFYLPGCRKGRKS